MILGTVMKERAQTSPTFYMLGQEMLLPPDYPKVWYLSFYGIPSLGKRDRREGGGAPCSLLQSLFFCLSFSGFSWLKVYILQSH